MLIDNNTLHANPSHLSGDVSKSKPSLSVPSDEGELIPSESTLEAIRELQSGGGIHYSSLEEFLADLDSWSAD